MIARFERKGLRIAALKLMQVDRDLAEQHYGEHSEQAVLPRADRVHHARPAGRDGAGGRGRGAGRAIPDRGDQPARGGAGLDPRRLRARGDVQPRARLGLRRRPPRARSGCGFPSCRRPPSGGDDAAARPRVTLAAAAARSSSSWGSRSRSCRRTSRSAPRETRRRSCSRNALRKARAVAQRIGPGRDVLGVDTEVLPGRAPASARQPTRARPARHLAALSGRTHEVFSGRGADP